LEGSREAGGDRDIPGPLDYFEGKLLWGGTGNLGDVWECQFMGDGERGKRTEIDIPIQKWSKSAHCRGEMEKQFDIVRGGQKEVNLVRQKREREWVGLLGGQLKSMDGHRTMVKGCHQIYVDTERC